MKLSYVLFYQLKLNEKPEFGEIPEDEDSIFFEKGFNQCDFTYLEDHIAKSFTFYHDQGGIQDRELFFENTRKNICANSIQKPIR